MTPSPPAVMLACPGLDHVNRGFETFARECFEALRGRSDLRIELVKATGGRAVQETRVFTPTRRSRAVRLIARRLAVEPFIVEHGAFALALIPLLMRRRPDVVYFSEWHVGRFLDVWRRLSRQRFALVLCNGTLAPGGYRHLDCVQQLVEGAIEFTLARGETAERQTLLPLGFAIDHRFEPLSDRDRAKLRDRLGLPQDRRVILSAGAINRQKRMDYLIEEVALLPEPRPYLVLAGQLEPESEAIRRLADERLGSAGHSIRSLSPPAMADLYRACDVFVLASLWESFGRVLVEAQAHGLPCLAHDHPVMRWVLGEEGWTQDLRERGRVGAWLAMLADEDLSDDRRRRRHRSAYRRFSWDVLANRYADLLRAAATAR